MKNLLAILALVVLAAGCGAAPEEPQVSPSHPAATTTSTTASNLGGVDLPVQRAGETYNHHPNRLVGSLMLRDNGCWMVDLGDGPRLVVFPPGFTEPPDGGALIEGPGGVRFGSGMEVDGIGGIVAAASLPAVPDGFWGSYLDSCEPDLLELVVVDSLVPAVRPEALGEQELIELLVAADLNLSWECGLGFTTSTADQTVAVSIHPRSEEAVASPVLLPAADWEAVVRIGKNLMVENCDDVVEGWEPQAQVVASWPVTAGTLEFTVPEDLQCSGSIVKATLVGGVVETPQGSIALRDLEVVNTSYGCFAG